MNSQQMWYNKGVNGQMECNLVQIVWTLLLFGHSRLSNRLWPKSIINGSKCPWWHFRFLDSFCIKNSQKVEANVASSRNINILASIFCWGKWIMKVLSIHFPFLKKWKDFTLFCIPHASMRHRHNKGMRQTTVDECVHEHWWIQGAPLACTP